MPDTYAPALAPEAMLEAYFFVEGGVVQCETHTPSLPSFADMVRDVAGSLSKAYDLYSPEVERLMALRAPQYRLAIPIALTRSVVGGAGYVADDDFRCWGSGGTFAGARADYEPNLIEMYEDLDSSEAPLSRLAEQTLEALQRHILKLWR